MRSSGMRHISRPRTQLPSLPWGINSPEELKLTAADVQTLLAGLPTGPVFGPSTVEQRLRESSAARSLAHETRRKIRQRKRNKQAAWEQQQIVKAAEKIRGQADRERQHKARRDRLELEFQHNKQKLLAGGLGPADLSRPITSPASLPVSAPGIRQPKPKPQPKPQPRVKKTSGKKKGKFRIPKGAVCRLACTSSVARMAK